MYLPRYVYNLFLLFDETKKEKTHMYLYLIVLMLTEGGWGDNTCGGEKKALDWGLSCRCWSLSCHKLFIFSLNPGSLPVKCG